MTTAERRLAKKTTSSASRMVAPSAMNDAPTDQVDTFHDSDHQYAKKLQTVHVCREGGEGARSSLMRIEVELLRTSAWWKAEGDENACLSRCKRAGLEFEDVIVKVDGVENEQGTRGIVKAYMYHPCIVDAMG